MSARAIAHVAQRSLQAKRCMPAHDARSARRRQRLPLDVPSGPRRNLRSTRWIMAPLFTPRSHVRVRSAPPVRPAPPPATRPSPAGKAAASPAKAPADFFQVQAGRVALPRHRNPMLRTDTPDPGVIQVGSAYDLVATSGGGQGFPLRAWQEAGPPDFVGQRRLQGPRLQLAGAPQQAQRPLSAPQPVGAVNGKLRPDQR